MEIALWYYTVDQIRNQKLAGRVFLPKRMDTSEMSMQERDEKIMEMIHAGKDVADIAYEVNLTPARIHQIRRRELAKLQERVA